MIPVMTICGRTDSCDDPAMKWAVKIGCRVI